MASNDRTRCRTCGDPLWPSLVKRHERRCRVCSGYYTRKKLSPRQPRPTEQIAFTDAELVAQLRRRSEWRACGSLTLLNLFAAAADRLEQLTQQESE